MLGMNNYTSNSDTVIYYQLTKRVNKLINKINAKWIYNQRLIWQNEGENHLTLTKFLSNSNRVTNNWVT